MSLVGGFLGNGPSGFGYDSTAEEVTDGLDLSGQNILVTGCNSGLGLETCRVLGLRGATVFAAARTEAKAREALAGFAGRFVPLACELAEPNSVRAAVGRLTGEGVGFDAVVANAGIMAVPKLELVHGYERQFFTNHIGHFMLVTGLLGALAPAGRVVMLSSAAHRAAPVGGVAFDNLSGQKSYRPWTAYGQSKMANLLFAKELARRFAGSARTANAVHPGVINTNLARHSRLTQLGYDIAAPIFLKDIPSGAATQVYAAVHPSMAGVSGEYLADSNLAKPRSIANDVELARRLWTESERIVAEL